MPKAYAKTIVQNDLSENIRPPRFIVRGHVHKKCHEQVGIIKALISREKFAQFMESVYQDFDTNYHNWLEDMDAAFEAWKRANQPV